MRIYFMEEQLRDTFHGDTEGTIKQVGIFAMQQNVCLVMLALFIQYHQIGRY